MTAGHCTCNHPRTLHRRGVGRCMAVGCSCMFAPAGIPRARRPEPGPSATYTVDGNSTVLDFQGPTPEQKKLAQHARLSEREKLERALWQRVEWASLPLPVLQYHWAKSEGRQFRADGAYVEQRVLLEVQGGIWAADPGRHNRGSGYQKDCERLCLAAALGWRVMYFTEAMIKSGEAVRLIAKAMGLSEVKSGSYAPVPTLFDGPGRDAVSAVEVVRGRAHVAVQDLHRSEEEGLEEAPRSSRQIEVPGENSAPGRSGAVS